MYKINVEPSNMTKMYASFKPFEIHYPVGIKEVYIPTIDDNNNSYDIVIGQIPNTVTHLDTGGTFNTKLEPNDIPNSVTHLTIGCGYNKTIDADVIPDSVTHLTMERIHDDNMDFKFMPKSVTHLTIDNNSIIGANVIPDSVTHLTMGCIHDDNMDFKFMPSSVTHLHITIWKSQNIKANNIPKTVTNLTLHIINRQVIVANIVPDSVSHLKLICPNNKLEHGCIPNSVTNLYINSKFDQDMSTIIPKSVVDLKMPYKKSGKRYCAMNHTLWSYSHHELTQIKSCDNYTKGPIYERDGQYCVDIKVDTTKHRMRELLEKLSELLNE